MFWKPGADLTKWLLGSLHTHWAPMYNSCGTRPVGGSHAVSVLHWPPTMVTITQKSEAWFALPNTSACFFGVEEIPAWHSKKSVHYPFPDPQSCLLEASIESLATCDKDPHTDMCQAQHKALTLQIYHSPYEMEGGHTLWTSWTYNPFLLHHSCSKLVCYFFFLWIIPRIIFMPTGLERVAEGLST